MATLGRTTSGDSTFPCDSNRALVSPFVLSEDGTVTAMSWRLGPNGTGTQTARGIVLANSAGTPGAVIATTTAVTVTTPVPAENTVYTAALSLSLPAGTYWLGIDTSNYPSTIATQSGFAASAKMANGTFSMASPPSTWPGTDATYDSQACVWLTYDAGAPAVNYTLAADGGSLAVTGTPANLARGRILVAATRAFVIVSTPVNKIHKRRLQADTRAFVTTGADAGAVRRYVLDAQASTYGLTGADASMSHDVQRSLQADAGSFALTGTAANLERGRTLAAAAGTCVMMGTDANLQWTRALAAAAGAFALAGADATLTHTRTYVLDAQPRALVLAGVDVEFTYSRRYVLDAEPENFALAGAEATLLYVKPGHYAMAANGGQFEFAGTDAEFLYVPVLVDYVLDAEFAGYTLEGSDADWSRNYILGSDQGEFVMRGVNAALIYSAADPLLVRFRVPAAINKIQVYRA